MISAFVGENSFEVREALAALIADFDGQPERYEGENLSREQLADLFGGNLLFAANRLIIIRDLSKNATLWPLLPDWLENVADTTHIVLVDEKPDKRTATYKALKSAGVVREFPLWGERDSLAAQKWVSSRAAQQGVKLSPSLARSLVDRVGMDQWQLASAIDKLALLDTVDQAAIDEHIEANPSENVFQLFELALNGKHQQLRATLQTLELSEDPYMVFALLSSQAAQMAAIAHSSPDDNVAKDFGIHPFVVSKLSKAVRSRGLADTRRIVTLFADADRQLKTSAVEPWRLVEITLLKI